MGPIWGRQDPGGPHVGPMNFAIWEILLPGLGSKLQDFVEMWPYRFDIWQAPRRYFCQGAYQISI